MLQSMGLERVGHDWVTEQQQQVSHISGIMQCLSFCDWLISFNVMSSKFICSMHI